MIIFTGDEVLSVNGKSFEGFTHKEALDTFKVDCNIKYLLMLVFQFCQPTPRAENSCFASEFLQFILLNMFPF